MINDLLSTLEANKAVGAMLGAAYGDALGWPNERARQSNLPEIPQNHITELRKWTRHTGGRFYPSKETVNAGEYSDDTQMILCVSRSLFKGSEWHDYFTQVELPFWTIYERGGGSATKKAANSWLDGVKPWSSIRKPIALQEYFYAGGNGSAMRVLPHVLHLDQEEFRHIASNIFLDGITTHGHPRAILGALVYGFALWFVLRKNSTLGYGELIESLLENEQEWSTFPAMEIIETEWLTQANKHHGNYEKLWVSTKDEILELLNISQSELSKGAVVSDEHTLDKMQCFDKQMNGAGTVSAISAVYLASRYAVNPVNGVTTAAYAFGADTDTIASMTGGLLGCIDGVNWLSSVKEHLQDVTYIEIIAQRLGSVPAEDISSFKPLKRADLKIWLDDVIETHELKETILPDGRRAKVKYGKDKFGRSGKYKIENRKLTTEDGQTLCINKISKGKFSAQTSISNILQNDGAHRWLPQNQHQEALKFGPKLPVNSIERSVKFYREFLGLTISSQTKDQVFFDQGLVLASETCIKGFQINEFRTLMYLVVSDIEKRYNSIRGEGLKIVTKLELRKQSERKVFRCLDPDGNLVEVIEKR